MEFLEQVRQYLLATIETNDHLHQQMHDAAAEIASHRADMAKEYKTAAGEIVSALVEGGQLDILKSMTDFLNQPDAVTAHWDRMAVSQQAESDLKQLIDTYGSSDDLEAKKEEIKQETRALNKGIQQVFARIGASGSRATDTEMEVWARVEVVREAMWDRLQDDTPSAALEELLLGPVIDFNKRAQQAGRQQIDKEGISYFTSKGSFAHNIAVMTNEHYRTGRELIRLYQESNVDIIKVQDFIAQKQDLSGRMNAIDDLLRQIDELSGKSASPENSLKEMEESIASLFADPGVFRIVVEAADKIFPQALVAPMRQQVFPDIIQKMAKAEMFKDLEVYANLNVQEISKRNSQLTNKVKKITAQINRGDESENIGYHFDEFKQDQDQLTRSYAYNIQQVKTIMHAIKSCPLAQSANSADSDDDAVAAARINVMVFLMDQAMQQKSGVDLYAVHHFLTIPDAMAADKGIDLSGLAPVMDLTAPKRRQSIKKEFNESANDNSTPSTEKPKATPRKRTPRAKKGPGGNV